MSKKSGSVVLSITVVLTLFVAASVFLLSPARGSDSFASQVMEEAKKRQNSSVVTVSEPLETNTSVRSDEEKMAGKVSELLLEDQSFLDSIGNRSTAYIESALEKIEEEYASGVDEILTQKVDDAFASRGSELDSRIDSNNLLLDEKISGVENSVESRMDALDARLSTIENKLAALENRVSELGSSMESRIVGVGTENKAAIAELEDAYISLEKEYAENKAAIAELRDTYNKPGKESTETEAEASSQAPLPEFITETDSLISNDDYRTQRETLRSDEISRVMSYFGL